MYFFKLLQDDPEHEGMVHEVDAKQYMQWFNAMAAQRHLKVAGIFSRLCYRDNKRGYLADIPRTVSYLVDETEGVKALGDLRAMLLEVVIPALIHKQPEAREFFI